MSGGVGGGGLPTVGPLAPRAALQPRMFTASFDSDGVFGASATRLSVARANAGATARSSNKHVSHGYMRKKPHMLALSPQSPRTAADYRGSERSSGGGAGGAAAAPSSPHHQRPISAHPRDDTRGAPREQHPHARVSSGSNRSVQSATASL